MNSVLYSGQKALIPLPCPFCGADDSFDHWASDPQDGIPGMIHQISCTGCGCDGPPGSSLPNAVRMWNDRGTKDAPPKWKRRLIAKNAKRKV